MRIVSDDEEMHDQTKEIAIGCLDPTRARNQTNKMHLVLQLALQISSDSLHIPVCTPGKKRILILFMIGLLAIVLAAFTIGVALSEKDHLNKTRRNHLFTSYASH